jgi:hypothetical protein
MSVQRQARRGKTLAHMPFSFPGIDRLLYGFTGAAQAGGVSLSAEMRRLSQGVWGG